MKQVFGALFATAWRIALGAAVCVAMIVVVFALPEVTDGHAPMRVWAVLIPALLVAALGPLFLFKGRK